jgi:anti-sigma regulatory factor (Ser/Thr protein kinase)
MADHTVVFYDDEPELVRTVGHYLAAAVRAGERAIAICTDAHRLAFEASLADDGMDVGAAVHCGLLRFLDAPAVLATFTSGGDIDPAACREELESILDTVAEPGRPVRVFGELVVLLWDAGQLMAAIRLEELWGELLAERAFSLLCTYPADLARGESRALARAQVCDLHDAVLHPSPAPAGNLGRSARISRSAEFDASRTAPGEARRWVADTLGTWAQADHELLDDAALVVTELATNAVLHTGSPFTVAVRCEGPSLRISVSDANPTLPVLGDPSKMDRFGRGLGMVERLSDQWGVEPLPGGKVVWVELGTERAR